MWFKVLLGASFAGAIIAWLTFSLMEKTTATQSVQTQQLREDSLKFDEQFNMFNANMFNSVDDKLAGKFFLEQAYKSHKKIEDIERKKREAQQRLKTAQQRLKKQMQTMNSNVDDLDTNINKSYNFNDI